MTGGFFTETGDDLRYRRVRNSEISGAGRDCRTSVARHSGDTAQRRLPDLFEADIMHGRVRETGVKSCNPLQNLHAMEMQKAVIHAIGRLAQLVRALLSHGRGHRFEFCIAHYFAKPRFYPFRIAFSAVPPAWRADHL